MSRDICPKIRQILLPQDCLLCGAATQGTGAEALLCAGCTAELPILPAACPQCAAPSPGGQVCGRCLSHPPHFERSVSPWRYTYPADRLLQALKYGGRLALAELCAARLAQAAPLSADLIVPMPLHARRLAERGFNQALEIARPLARLLDCPLDVHAARRVRDTAAQTGLPFAERVKNVRGAFVCERDLNGLTVAVVDDVMTTGATLDELAKTLKRAGAARVENWIMARTLIND